MNLKQAVAAGSAARKKAETASRNAAQRSEDAARRQLTQQARIRAKEIDPAAIYRQITKAVKDDESQVFIKNDEVEAMAIRLVCPDVTVTRDSGTVYEGGEATYDTWYGGWYIKIPHTEE